MKLKLPWAKLFWRPDGGHRLPPSGPARVPAANAGALAFGGARRRLARSAAQECEPPGSVGEGRCAALNPYP